MEVTSIADLSQLPPGLPVPHDDGAADGVPGRSLPSTEFESTSGDRLSLGSASARTLVAYVYPQTGVPGRPPPDGWDAIPGARGCTPQSCAFRDHARELDQLGADVLGISSQALDEQREFHRREHLPFPLLHDGGFVLAHELGLPTFEVDGVRYYRRLTLICRASTVVKVFYPVFPPQENAAEVAAWLR